MESRKGEEHSFLNKKKINIHRSNTTYLFYIYIYIQHTTEIYALHSSPNIIHVWGREGVHTGFRWENLKEGDHLEDPGVDERIILKCILRKWDGGIDWINLAQDRSRWLALVNTVMNLMVP